VYEIVTLYFELSKGFIVGKYRTSQGRENGEMLKKKEEREKKKEERGTKRE
jgi:hypothetical protein